MKIFANTFIPRHVVVETVGEFTRSRQGDSDLEDGQIVIMG